MDITMVLGALGIVSMGLAGSLLRRRATTRPRPPAAPRMDDTPVAVAPHVTVTFTEDVPPADREEIADFFAWRFRNLDDD